MRVTSLIAILSVVAISCGRKTYVYIGNEQRFGNLYDGLPDRDSTVTELYKSGIIKSEGKYAITDDSLLSNLKSGNWKGYYDNGQLKSEGGYKVSSYLNCCIDGPCREYYSYKDGLWKYFNEKGGVEYEVEFLPTHLHVNTTCDGGDSLIFGLISAVPLKYSASLTPDTVFELQKVKVEDDFGIMTYTPLNGVLYVRWQPKK